MLFSREYAPALTESPPKVDYCDTGSPLNPFSTWAACHSQMYSHHCLSIHHETLTSADVGTVLLNLQNHDLNKVPGLRYFVTTMQNGPEGK